MASETHETDSDLIARIEALAEKATPFPEMQDGYWDQIDVSDWTFENYRLAALVHSALPRLLALARRTVQAERDYADLLTVVSDLEARAEAAERDRDESDHDADTLRKIADDVMVGLDVRCVDDPTRVGCDDERPHLGDHARRMRERAEAAEAALAEATRLLRVFRDGEPRSEDCWAADRLLAKGGTQT